MSHALGLPPRPKLHLVKELTKTLALPLDRSYFKAAFSSFPEKRLTPTCRTYFLPDTYLEVRPCVDCDDAVNWVRKRAWLASRFHQATTPRPAALTASSS